MAWRVDCLRLGVLWELVMFCNKRAMTSVHLPRGSSIAAMAAIPCEAAVAAFKSLDCNVCRSYLTDDQSAHQHQERSHTSSLIWVAALGSSESHCWCIWSRLVASYRVSKIFRRLIDPKRTRAVRAFLSAKPAAVLRCGCCCSLASSWLRQPRYTAYTDNISTTRARSGQTRTKFSLAACSSCCVAASRSL